MAAPVFDLAEACWAVYQMCNFSFMRYLSESLRRGKEHCVSPTHVYIPPHIETALNTAIAAFKPGEPMMRAGNNLFGRAELVFDAEEFKFLPNNPI